VYGSDSHGAVRNDLNNQYRLLVCHPVVRLNNNWLIAAQVINGLKRVKKLT
jgi:hypothetical protein